MVFRDSLCVVMAMRLIVVLKAVRRFMYGVVQIDHVSTVVPVSIANCQLFGRSDVLCYPELVFLVPHTAI